MRVASPVVKRLNPIQDGGGQKDHSTRFSPGTSTNAGIIAPKTFSLLVLTFLPHWCKILRPYLESVLNY